MLHDAYFVIALCRLAAHECQRAQCPMSASIAPRYMACTVDHHAEEPARRHQRALVLDSWTYCWSCRQSHAVLLHHRIPEGDFTMLSTFALWRARDQLAHAGATRIPPETASAM